jgi:hypothetical protein
MDYSCWFPFGATHINGCDFKEIFLLTVANLIIIKDHNPPVETISNILNRPFLDYSDNFRYDTIERIKMYDKEEYYR